MHCSPSILQKARSLVVPYEPRAGFVGAFLYGSSSRPYADAYSDIDVQVVFDDEVFRAIAPEDRHVAIVHEGRKVGDVWLISPSWLIEAMDTTRRRLATGVPLCDPRGRLAALIDAGGRMPSALREQRMRVHYFDATSLADDAVACVRRNRPGAARLLVPQFVIAASALLFVERSEWPAATRWVFEELALAGVPPHLIEQLRDAALADDPKALQGLRGVLDSYLQERGVAFVGDIEAVRRWIFYDEEGVRAVRDWGILFRGA